MKYLSAILLFFFSIDAFTQNIIPDETFTTGTGIYGTAVRVIKQLPDGKIIIAGDFSKYNGNPVNNIARLNQDGSYDASFSPLLGFVESMIVETDGKIVVTQDYGKIKRLNADGSVDQSFNCTYLTSPGPYRIAKQNNKYIIAGSFNTLTSNGVFYYNLARLNYDGSLDDTFMPTIFTGSMNPMNIMVQPDNKIIVTGRFDSYNGVATGNVIRLTPNGQLDTAFNAGSGAYGYVNGIGMQPDGKYIICGMFENFNGEVKHLMVRLNSDGSTDDTFNYTNNIGLPEDGINGYNIIVQPNNQILISGGFMDALQNLEGTPDGSIPFYMVKLNTDGSIDTSFATGFNDSVLCMDIQSDGKLLAGGWFKKYNDSDYFGAVRLNYMPLSTKNNSLKDMSVYPNPVFDKLNINTDMLSNSGIIALYDMLGKEIYKSEYVPNAVFQIDMFQYTSGIYMLKITSGKNVFTKKIIRK